MNLERAWAPLGAINRIEAEQRILKNLQARGRDPEGCQKSWDELESKRQHFKRDYSEIIRREVSAVEDYARAHGQLNPPSRPATDDNEALLSYAFWLLSDGLNYAFKCRIGR